MARQGEPIGFGACETIKRFATGKGNADKQADGLRVIRERGFAPVDDNESDALALLLWAIETRGGTR